MIEIRDQNTKKRQREIIGKFKKASCFQIPYEIMNPSDMKAETVSVRSFGVFTGSFVK